MGQTSTVGGGLGQLTQVRWAFAGLSLLIALGATPAGANVAPVIDSFQATPASVLPGGTAHLVVQAHDPDCADVCTSGCGEYIPEAQIVWQATGGSFENQQTSGSGSPITAEVDWLAPEEEGTYTITVSVGDSGGFFCGGKEIGTADLLIQVTLSTNEPPVVESLVADPQQLFPGGTSSLTCVGSDPEGLGVTYDWSADSGTVTPGAAGSATFEADGPAGATVTCTVTDPEGASAQDVVVITVVGAVPEKAWVGGLAAPQRLAVDSFGDVYVVDQAGGGIVVFHLLSGEPMYRLTLPGLTSVDVDWDDRLLAGGDAGAAVLDRDGTQLLELITDEPLGEVADVAVDHVNRRYGVLHRAAGRVLVYNDAGIEIASFGSNGDAPEQLKSPQGLAVDASGNWLVADSGHGKIKTFDLAGNLVGSFGDLGGDPGEFVQLDDVSVDSAGVIYASDAFQDWIQALEADGTPRELLGKYGSGVGEFMTAGGVVPAPAFDRLLAVSTNSASVQVFVTSDDPPQSGPAPMAAVAPAALTFDPQPVGTTSGARIVTLSNPGDAPLGLRSVKTPAGFVETHACLYIDPGSSCELAVRFVPTTIGLVAGELIVDTSDPSGALQVGLTGMAFKPATAILTPDRLDYSDQEVGTVSEPELLTLTNGGTVELAVLEIATAGEFFQTNDCGGTVPGGASCTIAVHFTPQTVADYVNGTAAVTTDAVGSPHVVPLEGRGIPGEVLVSIGDASAGEDQETLDFQVTLSNPGADIVSVGFETSAGTATEGQDYEPLSGTLSFGDNETQATISVPLVNDTWLEPEVEQLYVTLTDPTGASLADPQGQGEILDDELCPGFELLLNGGAEDPPVGPGIPSWTPVVGTDWKPATTPVDAYEGEQYFSAGVSVWGELIQDVDLSAYASRIAGGEQRFLFEGRVRSRDEPLTDTSRIIVEYRDADNIEILDAFDTGDLSSPGAWLAVSDERTAPVGTGWVRVRLIATLHGGVDNDGWFDALSLRSLRAPTIDVEDAWRYEGNSGTTSIVFPISLACPFQEPIDLAYATADGSAVTGEDYAGSAGTVALPAGEIGLSIPVSVFGDTLDEENETFSLDLELLGPADAVLLDARAEGRIANDDFCTLGVDWWIGSYGSWPVETLTVGGEELEAADLLDLLSTENGDAAARLAAELVATKLNLAGGSDPSILPDVEAADAFLVDFPPGSGPTGADKKNAQDLRKVLNRYNNAGCEKGSSSGHKPLIDLEG